MRRLQRDLEKSIKNEAIKSIRSDVYSVTCSHCGHSFKAKVGKSRCPSCRQVIDLDLNIKFR
ncbi:MAG: zinc ribbon domain-containing protein [Emergencia sp.]